MTVVDCVEGVAGAGAAGGVAAAVRIASSALACIVVSFIGEEDDFDAAGAEAAGWVSAVRTGSAGAAGGATDSVFAGAGVEVVGAAAISVRDGGSGAGAT